MPFILIAIGIVLVIHNYRVIKRNSVEFEIRDTSRDKSFGKVLNENKEGLDEYKLELGLLRKNLAESLTDLQLEILDIKKELNMVKDNGNLSENKIDEENMENIDVISEINFNNKNQVTNSKKTKSIADLLKEGKTVEEICQELSISKGEVLLVQQLLKK